MNSRSETKKKKNKEERQSNFISSIRSKDPQSCRPAMVEGAGMTRGRFGIFVVFVFVL